MQGAAESLNGNSVGAMLGGRGCIEDLGSGDYRVSIAWQGLTPVSTPPTALACGKDSYDGAAGSACVSDRCRRIVSIIVRVADLK
ncbi:hypothetical protein D3C78_1040010 [compost metagenome]